MLAFIVSLFSLGEGDLVLRDHQLFRKHRQVNEQSDEDGIGASCEEHASSDSDIGQKQLEVVFEGEDKFRDSNDFELETHQYGLQNHTWHVGEEVEE